MKTIRFAEGGDAALKVLAPRLVAAVCGEGEGAWVDAFLISAQIFGGVSGSVRASTPSEESAAETAFAITPPTGTMPPSPPPFAPSGLWGEGEFSSTIALTLGKSAAEGMR